MQDNAPQKWDHSWKNYHGKGDDINGMQDNAPQKWDHSWKNIMEYSILKP